MGGFFLACCVRGMEVTRHYTAWQSSQVVVMAAVAMAVAGLILIGSPLLKAWRARA